MNRAPLKLVAALIAVLGIAPVPAFAGIGQHLSAAIEHTEEAISDTVKRDTSEMGVHLRSALGHAREALHEEAVKVDRAANKILHSAIRHLKQAEAQARFNHGAKAEKHAEDALIEMRKIK